MEKKMIGLPPGTIATCSGPTRMLRVRLMYDATASRNSGPEQPRMREQVPGHERPVAVPAYADPIAIDHAHLNPFIDRRLGRFNDLFYERIVYRKRVPNDRHRCVIEHRVSLKKEEEVRDAPYLREPVGGTRDLPSG